MSRFNTTLVRLLLSSLSLGFLLLANGCKVPANGPTDPVVFIKEGRQWTVMDKTSAPADPSGGMTTEAAAAPVDRAAPTRPAAQATLP